jgi:hypothetical protein
MPRIEQPRSRSSSSSSISESQSSTRSSSSGSLQKVSEQTQPEKGAQISDEQKTRRKLDKKFSGELKRAANREKFQTK